MTAEEVGLQLVWVAAIFGLRERSMEVRGGARPAPLHAQCWDWVHDLTDALGHPPFPATWGDSR